MDESPNLNDPTASNLMQAWRKIWPLLQHLGTEGTDYVRTLDPKVGTVCVLAVFGYHKTGRLKCR